MSTSMLSSAIPALNMTEKQQNDLAGLNKRSADLDHVLIKLNQKLAQYEGQLLELPEEIKKAQDVWDKEIEWMYKNHMQYRLTGSDRSRRKRRYGNLLGCKHRFDEQVPSDIEHQKTLISRAEDELQQVNGRIERMNASIAEQAALVPSGSGSSQQASSGDGAKKRKATASEDESPPKKQKPEAAAEPHTKSSATAKASPRSKAMRSTGSTKSRLLPSKKVASRAECNEAELRKHAADAATTSSYLKPQSRFQLSEAGRPAKRPAPDEGHSKPAGKRQRLNLGKAQRNGTAATSNRTSASAPSKSGGAGSAKRPAEDSDDEEEYVRGGPKHQKLWLAGGKKEEAPKFKGSVGIGKKQEERRRKLKGLSNHGRACFANTVIQLLDSAFKGSAIDKICSKKDDVETFRLSEEECERFNGRRVRHSGARQAELLRDIKAAAAKDETEKVSPATHLRKLIDNLRDQESEKLYAAPYVFQNVFAFGGKENAQSVKDDSHTREKLSGDDSQDALEYYQAVLNALESDKHCGDSDAVKKLFEIKMKVKRSCPDEACGHSEDLTEPLIGNHNEIPVPKEKRESKHKLSKLLSESRTSETDIKCPKCSETFLTEYKTPLNEPDNVVFRLSRNKHTENGVGKVMTPVELDKKATEPGAAGYELAAVVFHQGETLKDGHYIIFRKEGGTWYKIDDQFCEESPLPKFDGGELGQAYLLLYKKIDTGKGSSNSA